jgi:hypothetical protein
MPMMKVVGKKKENTVCSKQELYRKHLKMESNLLEEIRMILKMMDKDYQKNHKHK